MHAESWLNCQVQATVGTDYLSGLWCIQKNPQKSRIELLCCMWPLFTYLRLSEACSYYTCCSSAWAFQQWTNKTCSNVSNNGHTSMLRLAFSLKPHCVYNHRASNVSTLSGSRLKHLDNMYFWWVHLYFKHVKKTHQTFLYLFWISKNVMANIRNTLS